MRAEQHRRAKELFLELCRLSRPEQEEQLARLDDRELVAELESLLAFYEEPEPDELDPSSALSGTPPDTEASVFAAGTVIGDRYRIVRGLSRGGRGTVFEAEDLTLRSRVALKFLRPSGRSQELLNEVRLARQVTHPNVCRVYDLGEIDGLPFISMEYVDGEDLGSLLTRIGRIPSNRTVAIARQLFCALAAAHARGVLHRDLKPANIMIDGRGEVRITDFGIATHTGNADAARDRAGSPAFMAPEVLEGGAPTEKSDLYAMGLLLYEMCTGDAPFRADTYEQHRKARFEQPVRPMSARIEDVDPTLERIVMRCLEPAPEDRPSSALVIAAALPGTEDPLTLADDIGATPSPEMVAEAGSRGRLPVRTAALLAGLVVALLTGVVLLSESARGLDRVDLSLPPEVLAEKAREKLHALGWDEPPADFAYGYLENHYALATIDPSRPAPSAPGTASILFWYRQSPEVMVPAGLQNLVAFSGQVGPYDPGPSTRGTALVLLHPSGTLDHLEVTPPASLEEPRDGGSASPPGDELVGLLRAAGLDPARMEGRDGDFAPPFFADRRRFFVGSSETRPDIELEVRTASFQGRPIYFRMVPKVEEAEEEEEAASPSWLLDLVDEWGEWWDLIFIVSALAALPLMRHNLRRGRSDQRSARRLAIFVFALTTSLWLMRGPHLADIGTEWLLIQLRLGLALLQAGLVWLLYLAIEPYVRRIWPQALIAWTRLLAGRFRDPLVGSSTLYGVAIGTGWALLEMIDAILPRWLGPSAEPRAVGSLQFDYALTVGETLAGLGDHLLVGVKDAVFSLIILVLLRLVLPRPRMAAVAYVLLTTALYAHEGTHPSISWLTVGLAPAVLEVFTLMRFGLLTYAVASFSSNVLLYSPITLDVTAWYAGTGYFVLLLLTTLAGSALLTASRPRWRAPRSASAPTSNAYR